MVTVALSDADLRRRAWSAAAQVVDPEIPVLTIADLGVLRDVAVHDGHVEVAITPTYSGCPAMNMIALEIELALEREGIHQPKVPHRAVAGLDHRLDERGWSPQAEGIRHRAAAAGFLAPRAVRRATGRVPAMRLC
ncbi:metal-sulfur cluster biosynthetic enzyme [Bradyrhizobium elkanii]